MCPGMDWCIAYANLYYLLKNLYESNYDVRAKVYGIHAKVSYSSTIPACRLTVVTSPQVDSQNDKNNHC